MKDKFDFKSSNCMTHTLGCKCPGGQNIGADESQIYEKTYLETSRFKIHTFHTGSMYVPKYICTISKSNALAKAIDQTLCLQTDTLANCSLDTPFTVQYIFQLCKYKPFVCGCVNRTGLHLLLKLAPTFGSFSV